MMKRDYNIKKTSLLLLIIGLFSINNYAQQEYRYSQYMYAKSLINPGFVGTSGNFNLIGMHRSQWVGVPGAPETQFLSLETAFKNKLGGGLNFVRDAIGPSTKKMINVDLAYSLLLNDKGLNLSFGIKGGFEVFNLNVNKLNTYNPNDPLLHNINNRVAPIFGVGAFLYKDNWFIGFSSPNLLKTKFYDGKVAAAVVSQAHLYLQTGMSFVLDSNLVLKPSILMRSVNGVPLSIDFSSSLIYKDLISIGASYNYNSYVSMLFGINLSKKFLIGYSYDSNLNNFGAYNYGSHEIILKYSFGKNSLKKNNN